MAFEFVVNLPFSTTSLIPADTYHSAFPILCVVTCLTLHIQDRLKIYLKPEANVAYFLLQLRYRASNPVVPSTQL